jgi:hypothetical protein
LTFLRGCVERISPFQLAASSVKISTILKDAREKKKEKAPTPERGRSLSYM